MWSSGSQDQAMLTFRLIDPNDYTVHDDGQLIGRIRLARERTPSIWYGPSPCRSPARRSATPSRWMKPRPASKDGRSTRPRKYEMSDVDFSGPKSSFAVAEVVLPKPIKALVKAKRSYLRPCSAEIPSPRRNCLCIVLPEYAFSNRWNSKPIA